MHAVSASTANEGSSHVVAKPIVLPSPGGGSTPSGGFMVSMVMDWLDAHPYQAEVLLTTLEGLGGAPRHRVVVQCTDRVPTDVVQEFRQRGHVVVIIEPYLDRTYCNKIAQLDHFLTPASFDVGTEGVLLLDLDIAVLGPLDIPDSEAVCGKVVDGPNPRLADIEQVFAKAGVALPEVIPSDWRERGETIATNLNGGVIYIPRRQVAVVRDRWRHWAAWMHADPEALPAARKHIDQVSFALTLAEGGIPWRHLPTHWNFPGGHNRTPSLVPTESVRLLHYHSWGLDDAGLVKPTYSETPVLDEGVAQVNAIVTRQPMAFFERFRRDRAWEAVASVPLLASDLFSPDFVAREVRTGCRRRLILHGGAPKTGTSSLQWHLAENRDELAARGIWFPPPSLSSEPKHQPLSAALRKGDIAGFVAYVERALRDMPDDTHTVIFTTEGIFNHWWDYPADAKAALRRLAALFDFELCLWLREPVAFAAALWAQYLLNPRAEGDSAEVQGRDVSLAQALEDDWFRRHLDYLGVFQEMELLLGKGRVRALPFQGDTVQGFLDEYDIAPLPVPPRRHNKSLGRLGIALARFVNRRLGDGPARMGALRCVEWLDRRVGHWAGGVQVASQERMLIEQSSAAAWRTMQPLLAKPRPRRRRQRPKVFCIGFHRTGTKSLAAALETLGYRVTGPNGARDPAIEQRALPLALALAAEFDALNDNPTPMLYKELDTAFPSSRFILTKRPTDAWLASAVRYFGAEETPMREWIYGHGSPLGFEAAYRTRYESHTADVVSHFRDRSDLLVLDFEAGDGWPELCAFLGEDIPETPFPHINRSDP